ncbi:MAG: hypothetical protein EZS28_047284 [Streblomastix strix]|uniref:Uncharacterized protein n=1 Tax=Streblomastix strix TaxID=222440 RepID=A0A5J4TGH0_9EUKA|nr:MAG: hypothetical protein EZS28_047284 [Streblomastix strix]
MASYRTPKRQYDGGPQRSAQSARVHDQKPDFMDFSDPPPRPAYQQSPKRSYQSARASNRSPENDEQIGSPPRSV